MDCDAPIPLPCEADAPVIAFLILVVIGVLTGGLELQASRPSRPPGIRWAGAMASVRQAWSRRRAVRPAAGAGVRRAA